MNITLPKARTHAFPLLALFAALALGGILYAPSHVHWRDSAEFVLGASYLDIVHPPASNILSARQPLCTSPVRSHLRGESTSLVSW
jgi:hypothetical protein